LIEERKEKKKKKEENSEIEKQTPQQIYKYTIPGM